jgi:acyl dehydratase
MNAPRYLEDYRAGETFETGSYAVTAEEAIAFARDHDAQSFHIDAEAAAAHPVFQGLSASGFFTLSVTHRLILSAGTGQAWGMIGKGIDKLRWPRPVRPGDVLRTKGEVVSVSRDPAQPFGIVQVEIQTLNQHDKPVLTMTVQTVVPVRAAAPAKTAA